MAAFSVTLPPSTSSSSSSSRHALSIFTQQQRQQSLSVSSSSSSSIGGGGGILSFHQLLRITTTAFRLRASRRPPQDGEVNWSRNRDVTFSGEGGGDYDDDDDEEEDDDRSLDLLIRFVDNLFKKISRRARKSLRSVLPTNIPSSLVGFSVNGVIILAFFWILKAFLEVVCTLGSVVFVSILLVRGVWTGISYFQQGRTNNFDDQDDNRAWTGTQPVA